MADPGISKPGARCGDLGIALKALHTYSMFLQESKDETEVDFPIFSEAYRGSNRSLFTLIIVFFY